MLDKALIIFSFLLVGLTYSVAIIFDIDNLYYFDISLTLAYLASTVLNTSLILGKRISIIYKYLAVAILIFVIWNTIFYFIFYYFYEVNAIFYVLQISSLFILLIYGIRKARLYDAKGKCNKKHSK
jgi:hypothetical protein